MGNARSHLECYPLPWEFNDGFLADRVYWNSRPPLSADIQSNFLHYWLLECIDDGGWITQLLAIFINDGISPSRQGNFSLEV